MRIVVRSQNARAAREIAGALEPAGLAAQALTGGAALRPAPDGEDVAIVDARDPEAAGEIAEILRAAGGPALAYVGAGPRAAAPSADGRLDGWIALDGAAPSLVRRLHAAVRQGVRDAEIAARARTAAALALPWLAQAPSEAPAQALFVGAPSPVFLALQEAFAQKGGRLGAVFTAFAAFDHIHGAGFDALALNTRSDADAALSFIGAVRRNRSFADWPIYALDAADGVGDAAVARGADEAFAPGADMAATAGWLAHDITRIRRRNAAVAALEAPLAGQDEAFAVFGYHLAGLAQSHHDRGWALSAGVLEITGAKRTNTARWRRGLGEIARVAARMARASDSVVIMDETRLVFAFPVTTRHEAEASLRRIVEVCDCTAFAAGDHGGGPLKFAPRAMELSPGESGAGLLTRLLDLATA